MRRPLPEVSVGAVTTTSPHVVAVPQVLPHRAPHAFPAGTTALAVAGSLAALLALSGSTVAVRRHRSRTAIPGTVELAGAEPAVPAPALEATPAVGEETQPTARGREHPPRRIPTFVTAEAGSLALVTVSLVLLRRLGTRGRRRSAP